MKKYLNVRGKLLDCSTPFVMGILNITPDSFYDGGNFEKEKDFLRQAEKMIAEGAVMIDVGAQSTRPGSPLISEDEEWKRLSGCFQKLRKAFPDITLSVDTFYSGIAERAVNEGADLINDVSGGSMDIKMFETVGRLKVPYVLTHIQGSPQTMQKNPEYMNVVNEVMEYFTERLQALKTYGVTDVILDPGFGFGKNLEHNFLLLSRLRLFKIFERPVLAGISRKSMINKVTGTKPDSALNGTTVLNTVALMNGVDILRVHDVKEAMEAIKLTRSLSFGSV